jgi:trigger factor
VLNIKGTVEGEPVLENTDRELILDAGSPYPVPGFAEAVVGMTPTETREFDLPYPDDHYNAEVAGKTGHFEVTLNEIRVEALPELDDEFAMLVGDYENLDELKASLRESLGEKALEQAEDEYEEQIWEKLAETATVDFPLVMVERELETIKRQLEQQMQQQSLDLETYFRLTNTTEEAWKDEVRPQAEQRVRRGLLLAEIVETEKLTLEEGAMQAEIERMVESVGEQGERMREMLESPMGMMSVSERLLTEKAVAQIKAIARGEDPPMGSVGTEEETTDDEAVTDEAVTDDETTDAGETTGDETTDDDETTDAETTDAETTVDETTDDEGTTGDETTDDEASEEETTGAGETTDDETTADGETTDDKGTDE